jgi:hypothetical protein
MLFFLLNCEHLTWIIWFWTLNCQTMPLSTVVKIKICWNIWIKPVFCLHFILIFNWFVPFFFKMMGMCNHMNRKLNIWILKIVCWLCTVAFSLIKTFFLLLKGCFCCWIVIAKPNILYFDICKPKITMKFSRANQKVFKFLLKS